MEKLSPAPSPSLSSVASLPVLGAVGSLLFVTACQDSSKDSGETAAESYYSKTSMGDTPCELLGVGESTDEGEFSGFLELGSWANEVREVLNDEGITVKIVPDDFDPLVCYGSDEVMPQEDQSYRFHFSAPETSRGEVWKIQVAYPESVYNYYNAGYTDLNGTHLENWELACFDAASYSRPSDNYGYVFDESSSAAATNLTVPGAPEGWDCDLRFINPR